MAVVIVVLLGAGLFFQAVASLGVLRLPDFYSRLHALSKAETLGVLLALGSVAVWQGFSLVSLKVLFVAVFFFLTNPTASHAIARAALRTGHPPVTGAPQDPG
ncbi:MAG: monovalent cation/H(+) antiporter subunit G [Candidatus Methylomirabilia bacterium]